MLQSTWSLLSTVEAHVGTLVNILFRPSHRQYPFPLDLKIFLPPHPRCSLRLNAAVVLLMYQLGFATIGPFVLSILIGCGFL